MKKIHVGFGLLAAIGVSACGRDFYQGAQGTGTRAGEVVSPNGMFLNGMFLNGMFLNGTSLSGVSLNSMQISNLHLEGSELVGTDGAGNEMRSSDFIGAQFTGWLSDDSDVDLRLEDVQISSSDSEVYLYQVSYNDLDKGWLPICGTDADGNPVLATALAGRWNYDDGVKGGGSHIDDDNALTFACMNAALGKCVKMGYKPWDSVQHCDASGQCENVALSDVHQACTRMLRADYCGDGHPNTVNGTPIDVVDDLGIQARSVRTWVIEAEWSPDGAPCVARLRIQGEKPWCAEAKRDDSCGDYSHYWSGTLLMDYIQEKLTYLNIDPGTINDLTPTIGGTTKPPRLPVDKIPPDIGSVLE